jgi:hypothetical protein
MRRPGVAGSRRANEDTQVYSRRDPAVRRRLFAAPTNASPLAVILMAAPPAFALRRVRRARRRRRAGLCAAAATTFDDRAIGARGAARCPAR